MDFELGTYQHPKSGYESKNLQQAPEREENSQHRAGREMVSRNEEQCALFRYLEWHLINEGEDEVFIVGDSFSDLVAGFWLFSPR